MVGELGCSSVPRSWLSIPISTKEGEEEEEEEKKEKENEEKRGLKNKY